jgi:2-deoxy-D-gluconate 3-dehydrogenase|eukprot:CAMPEP_0113943070 /NCGR_PEP_ID=MMETSP1339-20121228/19067_1 /TAXON_ID=94617 /ORGANISM="Fibrocapsa japonica" /LENGTH=316 /DNA_ID=CAMNT_0000947827 /DNA_START=218 /DNA_END=1168 /DNA_ORIENTATION=+ /assembly_acc=CAM_ASM_000762
MFALSLPKARLTQVMKKPSLNTLFNKYWYSNLKSPISLENKQAVVTGGCSGMGLVITQALCQSGASTTVIDFNVGAFEELIQPGGDFHSIRNQISFTYGDLSDASSTKAAANNALSNAGGTVDILINCAGVALLDEVETLSMEKFDKTMAINVRAPFILAQAFGPGMKAQRSGKIVNISSQASKLACPLHSVYCASKGAIDGLTRALVSEWGCYNVQINSINPSIVMTAMGKQVWGDPVVAGPMLNMIPARRFGEPNEIADLVLFLSSDKSNFINGQTISIDGGVTSVSTSNEVEPEEEAHIVMVDLPKMTASSKS